MFAKFAGRMAQTGSSVALIGAVHRNMTDGRNYADTCGNSATRTYLPDNISLKPAQNGFNSVLEWHAHLTACGPQR